MTTTQQATRTTACHAALHVPAVPLAGSKHKCVLRGNGLQPEIGTNTCAELCTCLRQMQPTAPHNLQHKTVAQAGVTDTQAPVRSLYHHRFFHSRALSPKSDALAWKLLPRRGSTCRPPLRCRLRSSHAVVHAQWAVGPLANITSTTHQHTVPQLLRASSTLDQLLTNHEGNENDEPSKSCKQATSFACKYSKKDTSVRFIRLNPSHAVAERAHVLRPLNAARQGPLLPNMHVSSVRVGLATSHLHATSLQSPSIHYHMLSRHSHAFCPHLVECTTLLLQKRCKQAN